MAASSSTDVHIHKPESRRRNLDGDEIYGDGSSSADDGFDYLIVRPEKGGVWDLIKFLVWADMACGLRFLDSSDHEVAGREVADHRWVILVSIIFRKIIILFSKPMEYTGYVVDFFLNLLSDNGNLTGLFYNLLHGKVVVPQRDTETFISTIGHLDGRIDLYRAKKFTDNSESDEKTTRAEMGDRELMDLCIMSSKLAYENARVVENVVRHHWKMHFVDFYNCWNDFQKELSTQVFIFCDKPQDANLILVSFRGTEPFDADDWSTDFDYSWYEIPKLGKVHMGFLEALGLGNRANTNTFKNHLLQLNTNFTSSNGVGIRTTSSAAKNAEPMKTDSRLKYSNGLESREGIRNEVIPPEMVEKTAYYAVRRKLKSLLQEHSNAKFVVTGHSLGGALAILFPTVLVLQEEMEVMKQLLGIYTFGQPRIGNLQLGKFMEAHLEHPVQKYFRVVYCNDLVPRLPYDDKTFLYKHFGVCLYYNSFYVEQKMDEEPNRNFFGLRHWIPEHLNALWELIRSLLIGYTQEPEYKEGWFSILARLIGLVLPGISAHCPTDYVNSVRLGRESNGHMSF